MRVDVVWGFRGFLKPIVDPPKLNRIERRDDPADQVPPARRPGTGRPRRDQPTYTPMGCRPPGGASAPATSVSKRSRRGLLGQDRTYSLIWKTCRHRTGCGLLSVWLADGTVHQAAVPFRGTENRAAVTLARPGRIGWAEEAAGRLGE